MSKQPPLVSLITVNYNQLAVTCEMLDSLKDLSFKDYEVIVVDNGSKEDPKAHLNKHYPDVKLIMSGDNLGFAGGNNLGIKACKGKYQFFINNDTELTEGLIEKLLALFERIPKLGVVCPKICYFNEDPQNQADVIQYVGSTPVNPYTARNKTLGELEEDRGQYKEARSTPYAHGAAMMIPTKVIEEVGLMPEDFFLYYEELDWCEMFRRAGYQIYVEPNAKIYHKESISVGKMSTLKTYYLTRNRILFMRRNKSGFQLLIFSLFLMFFTIPKNVLMYMVKGDFEHLKVFLKAIWWNVSNGTNSPRKEKVIPV